MATFDTGWISPTAIITREPNISAYDWVDSDNAKTDNNTGATCDTGPIGQYAAYWLCGATFQPSGGIPSAATIDGIQARIKLKDNSVETCNLYVKLRKDVNDFLNTSSFDKSDLSLGLTSSYQVFEYGSSSDLWGDTWSRADVTDSLFSVGFLIDEISASSSDNLVLDCDYVQVRIHYTIADQAITGISGIASAESVAGGDVEPFWPIEGLTGISSDEAFGTAVWDTTVGIVAGNIGSGEIFGTPVRTSIVDIATGSVPSSELFGSTDIEGGNNIEPSGIPSEEFFPETTDFYNDQLALPSIVSGFITGTAVIGLNIQAEPIFDGVVSSPVVALIAASSIASGEVFGTASVGDGFNPDAIESAEAFGSAELGMIVFPEGFNGEPVGEPAIDTFETANVDETWTVRFR